MPDIMGFIRQLLQKNPYKKSQVYRSFTLCPWNHPKMVNVLDFIR